MPPEIAPACHVHACPEPRSYCRQHLPEKTKTKTPSAQLIEWNPSKQKKKP